jgi:hypothetical protein
MPDDAADRLATYFVRSLYRSAPEGEPDDDEDDRFRDDLALVEDRIVLIRAASMAEALDLGMREATAYAEDVHVNPYGQLVRTRFLGEVEASELSETLGHGVEVFSSTFLVRADVSDARIRRMRMPSETSALRRSRIVFCHREFWRRASSEDE